MAGTNSGGMLEPIISFSNSAGFDGSSRGSMYPSTRPNWPAPPLCFLCVYENLACFEDVSR